MKILIVGDNFIRQYAFEHAKKVLKDAGFDIEIVRGGNEGEVILKKDPDGFCAVFLDINLTRGVNESMVLYRIRSLAGKMPIILVSRDDSGIKKLVLKIWRGERLCNDYICIDDWADPDKHRKIRIILNKIKASYVSF